MNELKKSYGSKLTILFILICVVFYLLMHQMANAQKKHWNNVSENLDYILDSISSKSNIPGFSVAIITNNQIAYTNSYGVKKIETRDSITNKTIFKAASISKTFVATAIMQLVENNKIHLDSSVVQYLPYFKMKDSKYSDITIRHLLSHSSGMSHGRFPFWKELQTDEKALELKVKKLANKRLKFIPGEKFSYSNWSFLVAGDIISKVSGLSFEDYIKLNILEPLEMNSSTFFHPEANKQHLATPHSKRFLFFGKTKSMTHFPACRSNAPEGGLHLTIDDFANWIIANINKGIFKNTEILKPGSYDIMWDREVCVNPKTNVYMGLGWFFRTNEQNQKIISYIGEDPGFKCIMYFIPEQKIGMAILVNSLDNTNELFEIIKTAMFEFQNQCTSE